MGVKSFRTGTGQKRKATERGLNRGRAEYFRSTRRTGLASPPRASSGAAAYQLRIPYHAYGYNIGTFSLGYAPDFSTSPEDLEFSKDGGNPISSFSGQQQSSSSASWGEILVELPTDGVLYIYYLSGTSYAGDFAIDDIDIENPNTGTVMAEITTTDSNFERSGYGQTSKSDHNSQYQVLNTSSTSTNGMWNLGGNGTPSTGTGPSTDSDGSIFGIFVFTEVSGSYSTPNKYFTLRTRYKISEYIS